MKQAKKHKAPKARSPSQAIVVQEEDISESTITAAGKTRAADVTHIESTSTAGTPMETSSEGENITPSELSATA